MKTDHKRPKRSRKTKVLKAIGVLAIGAGTSLAHLPDAQAYQVAISSGDEATLEQFLRDHPTSLYAPDVIGRLSFGTLKTDTALPATIQLAKKGGNGGGNGGGHGGGNGGSHGGGNGGNAGAAGDGGDDSGDADAGETDAGEADAEGNEDGGHGRFKTEGDTGRPDVFGDPGVPDIGPPGQWDGGLAGY